MHSDTDQTVLIGVSESGHAEVYNEQPEDAQWRMKRDGLGKFKPKKKKNKAAVNLLSRL